MTKCQSEIFENAKIVYEGGYGILQYFCPHSNAIIRICTDGETDIHKLVDLTKERAFKGLTAVCEKCNFQFKN